MATSKNASLRESGMTASSCPVTNVRSSNVARSFTDFHISYNASSTDFGSDTTAFVLGGRVFLILNGMHAEQMCAAASSNGVQGCLDYFVEHIALANHFSDHLTVAGLGSDPFEVVPTALAVIGQSNIDKITQALA